MKAPILLFTAFLLIQSCHRPEHQMTQAQMQEISNSATEVVKKVFEYSNKMDFQSGLNHYSKDPSSYFITDGVMHSLADLKQEYAKVGTDVEKINNTIEIWNVQILSPKVVTFTLPVNLQLKLIVIPEFNGQLIWTATLQKQEGQWMIVQSHESWLNCAEVAAALTPTLER